MKLSRLHHPATYAITSIILAEFLLSGFFHRRLSADLEEGRNPHARRNWDEYIRRTSIPQASEIRILLLSNSQARAPELTPERSYPWLLQQRLNRERRGRPVRVVNWSFGPNRVPEAIILLARARDLNPDVVLAVLPPTWFQEEDYLHNSRPTPLSMFPSDVVDTAWLYRDRFPKEFRDHYIRPVQVVDALLARYLPTYRYRDWPVSFLRNRLPWLEPFIPERDRAAWFMRGQQQPRPLTRRPVVDIGEFWPHPRLMRMFTEAAAPLRATKVFVLQPLPYHSERPLKGLVPMREHLQRSGWLDWNMAQVVPWPHFLEGNVHLTAEGHAIFAQMLGDRVETLLRERRLRFASGTEEGPGASRTEP
jgi:hypothetical protein